MLLIRGLHLFFVLVEKGPREQSIMRIIFAGYIGPTLGIAGGVGLCFAAALGTAVGEDLSGGAVSAATIEEQISTDPDLGDYGPNPNLNDYRLPSDCASDYDAKCESVISKPEVVRNKKPPDKNEHSSILGTIKGLFGFSQDESEPPEPAASRD